MLYRQNAHSLPLLLLSPFPYFSIPALSDQRRRRSKDPAALQATPLHLVLLRHLSRFAYCRQMSNFVSLVHVSTAFVHACSHNFSAPNQLTSGPVPLSFDLDDLLQKLRAKTRDEVEDETPDLLRRLGGWPNTCVSLSFLFVSFE